MLARTVARRSYPIVFGSNDYESFIINQLQPIQWLDKNSRLWQDSAATTRANSDNDPVGRWDDRSGNNNHIEQATTNQRPTRQNNEINSLRVVESDNTSFSQYIAGLLDGTSYTGITVSLIMKPLVTETTRGIWSFANSATSGTPFILVQRDNNDIRLYVDGGYRFTIPTANNVPTSWIIRADGTNWSLWVNGIKQSDYSAGLTNLANANAVYLHTGFSSSSKSQVAETIVIPSALKDDQINTLANFHSVIWGI